MDEFTRVQLSSVNQFATGIVIGRFGLTVFSYYRIELVTE